MKRRNFLQATLAMPAFAAMPSAVRETVAAPLPEGWHTYETVTKVEITSPSGVSRAWVPLPYAVKTDWHQPLGNKWAGNGQIKLVTDGKYGAQMVYAEWKESDKAPVLEVTSRFATRERAVDVTSSRPDAPKLSPAEAKFETAATIYLPTG